MLTDAELEALLDDLESDRVERKESAADSTKLRQAVCAFANDLPGHDEPGALFVGVDDSGEPVGWDITDRRLRNLSDMRDQVNILPSPSLTVQKRWLKGREVAVVTVEPADAPPVRYNGRIWIRVGPRRGIASPDEERRLNEKRLYRDVPADIRPVPSAGLDALDEPLFREVYLPAAVSREVLDENDRSLQEQLLALKLAHPGDPICPTRLGVLTIGREPTDWLPGAWVHFLRVAGTELGGPVRHDRALHGPVPDLVSAAEDLLLAQTQTAVDFTSGAREIRTPDYPQVALEQIVRNAILHRSYENTNAPVRIIWLDDRVEVMNPGGPYGQVTVDNFGDPGLYDYRNANLAAVMKELGLVNRFGYGLGMARRAMADNGNPEPQFLANPSYVKVILRSRL